MKTIIAGSRTIIDYSIVEQAITNAPFKISSIVSGGARGVDTLGERYAFEHSLPCHRFPANWNLYGKSAGYRRNEQMADNAEALIAIWDGQSRGTEHMINIATRKELIVFIYRTDLLLEEANGNS